MFKPIQFTYKPPKTILQAPATQPQVQPPTPAQPQERINGLLDQLKNLGDTADYLEQMLLANAAGAVVPVDGSNDPEAAQALQRIYGDIPGGITVTMYGNMLDTYTAISDAEIAARENKSTSGLKVNPVQKADLQTAINHYETRVVNEGDFNANTGLLLNQIKGDKLILKHLQDGLRKYEPSTDISPDLHDEMKQRLDAWQTYYSVMHAITSEVDAIYQSLTEIVQKYFYLPIDILLKLVAIMSAMKALLQKPKLGDIRASLVWLVYPRLISEVSKYTMLMDQVVTRATDPVYQLLGSLDRLFAQACSTTADAAYMIGKGNFSGLREQVGYAWKGKNAKPTKPFSAKDRSKVIAEMDKLAHGFASFQGHIAKAILETKRKRELKKKAMLKLLDRRLIGTADRLETLQSLRTAESVIQILQSMAREVDRVAPQAGMSRAVNEALNAPGSGIGQTIGSVQGNNGSLANVIAGVEQGANLSISVQDKTTAAQSKKKLPAPPPNVAAALKKHLPERPY